jgi:hypothetical protein
MLIQIKRRSISAFENLRSVSMILGRGDLGGRDSDCQGYRNPRGYQPRVVAGAGTGMKFVTLHKPVPAARVGGFRYHLLLPLIYYIFQT